LRINKNKMETWCRTQGMEAWERKKNRWVWTLD